MAKRQVFFSFEFNKDAWRASQVRNMGKVDDSSTFSDNDWEEVKEKTDAKIKEWIDYEIKKAYELQKAIVGIYVHGLKDVDGNQTTKGSNPFYQIYIGKENERLSKYVTCYDPPYLTSKCVYDDIAENISSLIEDAIAAKGTY